MQDDGPAGTGYRIARQIAELESCAEVTLSAFPEGYQRHEVIASPEGVPFLSI
jgi:hypothetical protein